MKPYGEIQVYDSIKEIADVFMDHGLNFQFQIDGERMSLSLAYGQENYTAELHFLVNEDDNRVRVRSNGIARVPPARVDAVLSLFSKLNNEIGLVSFYLNSTLDIIISYDTPNVKEGIGSLCYEIFCWYFAVLDQTYPRIMKTIWA